MIQFNVSGQRKQGCIIREKQSCLLLTILFLFCATLTSASANSVGVSVVVSESGFSPDFVGIWQHYEIFK